MPKPWRSAHSVTQPPRVCKCAEFPGAASCGASPTLRGHRDSRSQVGSRATASWRARVAIEASRPEAAIVAKAVLRTQARAGLCRFERQHHQGRRTAATRLVSLRRRLGRLHFRSRDCSWAAGHAGPDPSSAPRVQAPAWSVGSAKSSRCTSCLRISFWIIWRDTSETRAARETSPRVN